MSSAIFTNGNKAYQVANIMYAGSVSEVPEKVRQNGTTHSFKMITGLGTVFSYYKNEDLARKSRGALAAMLDAVKPKAFKNGWEFIDPSRIVSFSSVFQFKKPVGPYTHGFVLTMDTSDEKSQEIWLRYKSEDHAQKARKALWAAVHSVNGMSNKAEKPPVEEQAAPSAALPF